MQKITMQENDESIVRWSVVPPLIERSQVKQMDEFTSPGGIFSKMWTDPCPIANSWGGDRHGDLFSDKQTDRAAHWSMPWSDLMMTMFVLFATLYMFHSGLNRKAGSESVKRTESAAHSVSTDPEDTRPLELEMSRTFEMTNRTLKSHGLEDFASVDLIPNKAVRIVLAGDVMFDSGEVVLKPGAKRKLERIAGIIRQVPHTINVVGHTDDVPVHSNRFVNNWELSGMRACKVTQFLVEQMQVPADRFYISAHAYHQPLCPNDTVQDRAANRRVEIIMTPEKPYGHAEEGIQESGLEELIGDLWAEALRKNT